MTSPRRYASLMESSEPWLGKVPAHWQLTPLGTHFKERKEIVSDADFHPLSVTKQGVVPQMATVAKTDNGDSRKLVRVGDFAINARSDRKGSAGVSEHDGSVSVVYTILRPRASLDQRFVHHLLRSPAFAEEYYRWGNGIVDDLWSTRYSSMKRIVLAVPPLDEQRSIAAYLDHETAQIDVLIGKQERLIETLRERRDATWANLMDQATEIAPVVPLRRLIHSIVDGPFGSSLTSSHYVEAGVRVIRLGNVGINEFRSEDAAYVSASYGAELSAHAAIAGDVVIAGLGDARMPLGRATVVPDDLGPAIVKADCFRARPTSAISGAYLAWSLSSPQSRTQMRLLSRGSTRARLNTSVVRDVLLPVPQREKQDELLTRSAEQTAQIDALVAKAERFIEVSKERRAAVITAAVTGQIDVREHVGAEQTGVA